MREYKIANTSDEMKNLCAGDPGIDYNNYSFEEELERIKGYNVTKYFGILIRLHIEPPVTQSDGGVIFSDHTTERNQVQNKFTRPVGLVLKFSKGVYKDKKRYGLTGAACAIRDWIHFERCNISAFGWNKRVYATLMEDHVNGVLTGDPRQLEKLS